MATSQAAEYLEGFVRKFYGLTTNLEANLMEIAQTYYREDSTLTYKDDTVTGQEAIIGVLRKVGWLGSCIREPTDHGFLPLDAEGSTILVLVPGHLLLPNGEKWGFAHTMILNLVPGRPDPVIVKEILAEVVPRPS